MAEERHIDIADAYAAAMSAVKAKPGLETLVGWAQQPDWPWAQRVAVVMKVSWMLEERGRDPAIVELGKRLMDVRCDDVELGEALRSRGALMRVGALNRLTRFDDAWAVFAPALLEHLRDRSPSIYLPELFVLAADTLTGLGQDAEAGFARSLAADAKTSPEGRGSTASLLVGSGILLYRLGEFNQALEVFVSALDAFGLDTSSEDLRAAISGRAQSLLRLGRFRECIDACAEGREAIAEQGYSNARPLGEDLLKAQSLALLGMESSQEASD